MLCTLAKLLIVCNRWHPGSKLYAEVILVHIKINIPFTNTYILILVNSSWCLYMIKYYMICKYHQEKTTIFEPIDCNKHPPIF